MTKTQKKWQVIYCATDGCEEFATKTFGKEVLSYYCNECYRKIESLSR